MRVHLKNTKEIMKEFSNKISKGYRLTPGTHELIKSLQHITGSNAESVLSRSLLMYLTSISSESLGGNHAAQSSQEKRN